MKNYKIVQSESIPLLTSKVNKLLEEGWKVEGSIQVDSTGSTVMYLQTLVKENGSPIKKLLLG